MTTNTPQPINWKDVAIVVFDGDKPIIITSVEPVTLFDTFQSLVEGKEDDGSMWPETTEERFATIIKAIESYRWELHQTEQAKQLFCNGYAETEVSDGD